MFKLLFPHPAALVKKEKTKTLLITDPHIGWEIELQKKGIHIPSQTNKILQKLTTVLNEFKPEMLTILGDVKFTIVSSEISEWQDVPKFFNRIQCLVDKIVIVRGNHDANIEPLLPKGIEVLPATGMAIGDVGVFHGHKWPSPALLGCKTLVMGHVHPIVVFRDPSGCKITRQVWIKLAFDKEALGKVLLEKSRIKIQGSIEETLKKHFNVGLKASELYIMPSFNDFLGGRPINETQPQKDIGAEAFIGPVLRSDAFDVDNAELYLLDGTYLGTLKQLRILT